VEDVQLKFMDLNIDENETGYGQEEMVAK